jgi:parvulin-like peptidyl-prolyl isomerase
MAEELLAKAKEGAPFAELAAVYSDGRPGRTTGEAAWFERPVLRKELADAAFALKPGQYSGVIETPDSCYLLQAEDVELAHFRPLSEVHDQIEKDLQDQERERLLNQWVAKLRKKTFVATTYW